MVSVFVRGHTEFVVFPKKAKKKKYEERSSRCRSWNEVYRRRCSSRNPFNSYRKIKLSVRSHVCENATVTIDMGGAR